MQWGLHILRPLSPCRLIRGSNSTDPTRDAGCSKLRNTSQPIRSSRTRVARHDRSSAGGSVLTVKAGLHRCGVLGDLLVFDGSLEFRYPAPPRVALRLGCGAYRILHSFGEFVCRFPYVFTRLPDQTLASPQKSSGKSSSLRSGDASWVNVRVVRPSRLGRRWRTSPQQDSARQAKKTLEVTPSVAGANPDDSRPTLSSWGLARPT